MIISVEQAKRLINLNSWTDERIKMKLDAIEATIRAYTNNNFQDKGNRIDAFIRDGVIISDSLIPFKADDTIQISESSRSNGLYTVASVNGTNFETNEDIADEKHVLVTKVVYPADVIDCVVELMEWNLKFGKKVGIKSETLSRHSVTYEDSATLFMGYPVGILNGLKLHVKARF